MAEPHPYLGAAFALLTQHGKEAVIGPLLEATFGARVHLVRGFDTDQLGTFTREIPRSGTQLDAARKKARLAMELSRVPLGIGSEGAVGPLAFGSWDVELVVVLDAARGLEVVGRAEGPARHAGQLVDSLAAARAFAERQGFPRHGLVLRPDGAEHPQVLKGIASWAALEEAWVTTAGLASSGQVFVETELRAHLNPTRMTLIHEAMRDAVTRLATRCPACERPGYGKTEALPGLPCAECGAPTRLPRAERWVCAGCSHLEERPRLPPVAAPASCDQCNP